MFEFSCDPDCIFRAELAKLDRTVRLSDGTAFSAGDRIVRVHLWNEHIPRLAAGGATLQWARRMNRCLDVSLHELAQFLRANPHLGDIRAVRADMAFGTDHETQQLVRICGRYGFLANENAGPVSALARLHTLAENVLIALFVLARNPRALRRDCLRRTRVDVFLPRSSLDQRYCRAGGSTQ